MLMEIISRSFIAYRANLDVLFRIARIWLPVVVVWALFLKFALAPLARGSLLAQGDFRGLLFLLVYVFANLVIASGIAVPWHRLLLLRDRSYAEKFSFGPLEKRYLTRLIAMNLASLVYILVLLFVVIKLGQGGRVASLAITATVLPYAMRFSLVLPAAALSEPFSFSDAYLVSRGMGWRMFAATLALTLPMVFVARIVLEIVDLLLRKTPGMFKDIVEIILAEACGIAIALMFVSVLSISYAVAKERWFAGGRSA